MKILLIDYKYAYDRNWDNTGRRAGNYYFEYKPLKALADVNGHSVNNFFWDEAILEEGREGAREKFMEYISQNKPDVCIVHGFEYDMSIKVLQRLQDDDSITSVYICADDSWRWHKVSRHFAKYFNWVVTYDSKSPERYRRIGCKNVIHSKVGVDLDAYRNLGKKKDIDVSFVGLWGKQRGKIVDYLEKNGVHIVARGVGWPLGAATHEEMIDIINRSKIGLSLNPSSFNVDWRSIVRLFFRRAYLGEKGLSIKLDIHHFFANLRFWLQKRHLNIKARHFEIPACGTMEITHDADNLGDYYEPDKEIVLYDNMPDLVHKINYYLNHSDEREEIARRGHERTIREHSSIKRFEEIFATIGYPFK